MQEKMCQLKCQHGRRRVVNRAAITYKKSHRSYNSIHTNNTLLSRAEFFPQVRVEFITNITMVILLYFLVAQPLGSENRSRRVNCTGGSSLRVAYLQLY